MKAPKKVNLSVVLDKSTKMKIHKIARKWLIDHYPEGIEYYSISLGNIITHKTDDIQIPTFIPDIIQKTSSKYFQMPLESIYQNIRKKNSRQKRQIIQYFLWKYKEEAELSLSSIGLITGGYDHATILHSKNTVINDMETNKFFFTMVDELSDIIKINIEKEKSKQQENTKINIHKMPKNRIGLLYTTRQHLLQLINLIFNK